MSDDDTRRTAVSPPLSCANVEAASSSSSSSSPVGGFQELAKGETVSESVLVNRETEPAEANDTAGGAETVRSNDHEATKVKQRKCVQFTTTTTTTTTPPGHTADDTLRKFIEGEEILDKKNPFKNDDQPFEREVLLRSTGSVRDRYLLPDNESAILIEQHDGGGGDNDADDSDTDHDDDNVFITKEEILRQSKYVKTYIKNPDKQLNYDKSVIQKMNALKAKGRQVRDVVVVEDSAPPTAAVRPPIPAPRTVLRQSDRNNNSRRQALPQMEQRAGNPKPVPRSRRDYAEVKVRIGSAEAEESLYDSNEVVQNALKFDSRFRKVEFGSQDDIDSIAERTEDGSDQPVVTGDETVEIENRPVVRELKVAKQQISPRKQQPTDDQVRKTTFAEDVKKSFSNTVKSADFRKYLQSKGLSLVPAKSKAIEAARSKPQQQEKVAQRLSGVPVSSSPTSTRQQIKPSVLTRFFQNGLFAPKTPNDPAYSSAYGRSSTPVLFSTQARPGRPKPPARFGSFNGGSSLNKSSAIVADSGKPKVNFKQLVDGAGNDTIAPIRRPASVNDFERPRLRTHHLANRSVSSVDSLKRPVKNAGVQVNLATQGSGGGQAVRDSQLVPMRQPLKPSSSTWQRQQQQQQQHSGLPYKEPTVGLKQQQQQQLQHQVAYQSLRQRPDARFYGGSTNTVAPLYSEPLREAAPMMVPDETDSGFRSALDNGYHIYEQTPDNLRRGELVYGKIGYLSNTQLNRWHPQDRRSFSSMQEGGNVTGMNGGTYGRLRPLYVSSPLSTQSTPVRRGSDTIDREQILHRIYDFCRRSIRNSSRTSVHSNQTEPPLYHHSSGVVQGPAKIVPAGGSFPIERPRVQRVQSLTTPRSYVGASTGYTRAVVAVPAPPARYPSHSGIPAAPTQNQHERNIENIYAFVNKKMSQNSVGPVVGGEQQRTGRSMMVQTSAPSTLRRVTFSSNGIGHAMTQDGNGEADYVNIRGAPDGIQYRTTQC